jgi:hypothetical protein
VDPESPVCAREAKRNPFDISFCFLARIVPSK